MAYWILVAVLLKSVIIAQVFNETCEPQRHSTCPGIDVTYINEAKKSFSTAIMSYERLVPILNEVQVSKVHIDGHINLDISAAALVKITAQNFLQSKHNCHSASVEVTTYLECYVAEVGKAEENLLCLIETLEALQDKKSDVYGELIRINRFMYIVGAGTGRTYEYEAIYFASRFGPWLKTEYFQVEIELTRAGITFSGRHLLDWLEKLRKKLEKQIEEVKKNKLEYESILKDLRKSLLYYLNMDREWKIADAHASQLFVYFDMLKQLFRYNESWDQGVIVKLSADIASEIDAAMHTPHLAWLYS